MNADDILANILVTMVSVGLAFALVCIPLNYRAKDLYKKELILNCNGDLQCIQLILGKDNKFGY